MNRKIFATLVVALQASFNLPKYRHIVFGWDSNLEKNLPWTPARLRKFKERLNNEFDLDINFSGTILDIVDDIDKKYNKRFWDSIWQPRTEDYQFSGWSIVERINSQNPKAVLDVGCGFNQFKERIKNLVGIDPYNNCADYMVDVLNYNVPEETYDHIIAFGSINFGTYDDIKNRMYKIKRLLMPGGKVYMRVNPGIDHKNGPYIDIFEWSFDVALKIADEVDLELLTYKVDTNNRFYIEFKKPSAE